MKYLLVVDMQEDYIGDKRNEKRFPYNKDELINNINDKIEKYSNDNVIYIVNRFFWENRKNEKKLVDGIHVVSDILFEKKRGDSFSNRQLLKYLKDRNVSEIELVGVDGNYCVASTAAGGKKNSFDVYIDEKCIGVANKNKFIKSKHKLERLGIKIL